MKLFEQMVQQMWGHFNN